MYSYMFLVQAKALQARLAAIKAKKASKVSVACRVRVACRVSVAVWYVLVILDVTLVKAAALPPKTTPEG